MVPLVFSAIDSKAQKKLFLASELISEKTSGNIVFFREILHRNQYSNRKFLTQERAPFFFRAVKVEKLEE